MKLSFKLNLQGTIAICLFTLFSVALSIFATNEITILLAIAFVFVFFTCSKSDAFAKNRQCAWLVAITSIIVSLVTFAFVILIAIIGWIFHLIIRRV